MKTRIPHINLWCVATLTSGLTNCSLKHIAAELPPLREQEVTRFRRTDIMKTPILFGHVNVQDSKAGVYSLEGAIIRLNGIISFTDKNANYSLLTEPGIHKLTVGTIGIYPSFMNLKIERGDSVRINFRLRPDTRPTTN